MRKMASLFLLASFCVMAVLAAPAAALDVGQPGPAWKGLKGVDDKDHNLSDLKAAKAVVVCFTCNHCPVAVMYEDRLVELARDYGKKGVQLVAINVSNRENEKLSAMKVRAEEKEFNFPYLHDPSQEIGRKYGAKATPHVYLLDGNRKLAYVGAIDDNMKASSVSERYLRKAIDAVLEGKKPETTATKPFGCSIGYDK